MKRAGSITDPSYREACKNIAIHPGYVISPNDGNRHFIGFRQLCALCGIDPSQAVRWDEHNARGRRWEDYHHVYPKDFGDYYDFSKPEEKNGAKV